VLQDANESTSLAQRVWTTPRLRRYTSGARVALVGDAAHAMTPNLGRGGCEALADAVTLADLLNSRPIPAALRAYNRARVLRTQALRLGSSALMRAALAERAQPTRDRLVAGAGHRSVSGRRAAAVPR
jgi:2-polyprenyl-6-methoxyphenol hydroxylase-like FAD-dependent oxidoreductase